MNKEYYQTLFKRKSFHLFKDVGNATLSKEELNDIEKAYLSFEPLYKDIKTTIKIVSSEEANLKRDAEGCILIYSEKKDNYLINIGYLGEQLDLYLVSHNIGTLWYGLGRTREKKYNGLDFVIMMAFRKIEDESLFRKDIFLAKRKPIEELWKGETLGVAEIARFAPSACNIQPWFVDNTNDVLTVYRYKKQGLRGIIPALLVKHYNQIDIGIFLCFLEICLAEKGINFSRELFLDLGENNTEYSKIAEYNLNQNKLVN